MLLSIEAALQGEQVFITYGQQSNDKLLQYYGFVEAKNPSDVFVVPSLLNALKDLPYTDIPEERVRAVEQAGLMPALQQVRHAMLETQIIHIDTTHNIFDSNCAEKTLVSAICEGRCLFLNAAQCFCMHPLGLQNLFDDHGNYCDILPNDNDDDHETICLTG